MIIRQTQEIPVLAPQFNDMNAALALYRNLIGKQSYSMVSFVNFITQPSVERDNFLQLFVPTTTIENNILVTTYN